MQTEPVNSVIKHKSRIQVVLQGSKSQSLVRRETFRDRQNSICNKFLSLTKKEK